MGLMEILRLKISLAINSLSTFTAMKKNKEEFQQIIVAFYFWAGFGGFASTLLSFSLQYFNQGSSAQNNKDLTISGTIVILAICFALMVGSFIILYREEQSKSNRQESQNQSQNDQDQQDQTD